MKTTIVYKRQEEVAKGQWYKDLQGDLLVLSLRPGIHWRETDTVVRDIREAEGVSRVVIDCSVVEIRNASTLGWLLTVSRWCNVHGLVLKIVGMSPAERHGLDKVGVARLLPLADDAIWDASDRHRAVS
jgi:anti-anti-sigma regulatory factor